jgi:hypothetical protein
MHGDELGSARYKLRYRHGRVFFVIAAECAKAGNMARNMLKPNVLVSAQLLFFFSACLEGVLDLHVWLLGRSLFWGRRA